MSTAPRGKRIAEDKQLVESAQLFSTDEAKPRGAPVGNKNAAKKAGKTNEPEPAHLNSKKRVQTRDAIAKKANVSRHKAEALERAGRHAARSLEALMATDAGDFLWLAVQLEAVVDRAATERPSAVGSAELLRAIVEESIGKVRSSDDLLSHFELVRRHVAKREVKRRRLAEVDRIYRALEVKPTPRDAPKIVVRLLAKLADKSLHAQVATVRKDLETLGHR